REGGLDRRRMALGVQGLEGDELDLAGPERTQLRGRLLTRGGGPVGQHHPDRRLRQIFGGDRQRDLRAAAQQQHRLRITHGVDQFSSNLLAISDMNTPVGSTSRRTAIHSSMRGYIAWKVSAEVRDSFARYSRPPNSSTRRSRSARNSCRPGRIAKSTHTFQPGIGKLSGALLPGPNSLNTLRNE